MKSLKRLGAGYMDEQRDLLTRVRDIVAALGSPYGTHGIMDEEIADRVEMAAKIEASPDRSMILRVAINSHSGLNLAQSCECFHVKQARFFWDDAADAESATTSAFLGTVGEGHALNFALPDMPWTSTLDRFVREESRRAEPSIYGRILNEQSEIKTETKAMENGDELFMKALQITGQKYAKKYKGLTWAFLLCFNGGGFMMEPCCNSGPPMPRYTIQCSSYNCAPCSNVYDQGYSFPWAFCGMAYCRSCPYGPSFTSNPEMLASCAVNPSGRQWPERTICSSHPSGSCASDDHYSDQFFETYKKLKSGDGGKDDSSGDKEDKQDKEP